MTRSKQVFVILFVFAVILVLVRHVIGPVYFQTLKNKENNISSRLEEREPNKKSEVIEMVEPNPSEHKKTEPNKIVDPLEVIRRDCGELCDTSRPGSSGPYFDHVTANIDCNALFRNPFIDRTHGLKHAPKVIPPELMKEFTMDGKMKVFERYFDQPYLKKKALAPVWTYKQVEDWKHLARQGKLVGNYGIGETNALRDGLQHAPGVRNGRVLVIGSEIPWVEACVLESGAREIVTLEYGEIVSEHPHIKTVTPMQFRKDFLAGILKKFDAVVTFSSVEHSGLGRYGDALNPWGDLIAIARSWCVTKKGGSLTIGVMYNYEQDAIRFNADRWYGKVRYPYLTTNWKQFYRGTGSQRVHVFTNGYVNNATNIVSYLKPPHPYMYHNNTDQKYSQGKQDVTVYNMLPKKRGFFIEMGAFDGIWLSNTLWLERHHNWTGLLIEANPENCAAVEKVKRGAWLLCACISTKPNTTFIKGNLLGGVKDYIDEDHMKALDPKAELTVPCFRLGDVLEQINQKHIDYFSLDVEGAELFILESIKNDLKSQRIIVDIWTIEYMVYDGTKVIKHKSLKRLQQIRQFFKDLGGYVEHSKTHASYIPDTSDEMGLDVVFVNVDTWCKKFNKLPYDGKC